MIAARLGEAEQLDGRPVPAPAPPGRAGNDGQQVEQQELAGQHHRPGRRGVLDPLQHAQQLARNPTVSGSM